MTATDSRRRRADGLRPDDPQGRRPLHPRQGQLRRRRQPARHAARGDPAQPVRARQDRLDRHQGRRGASEGQGRHHRRGAGDAGPGVDADAVLRHAGRARHRQGALPGPGGRVRRRRGPLLGPRRARTHRRRIRGRCRPSSTPSKAMDAGRPGHPRRQGGQDRQPHLRLGVRRQGEDRRGLRRRRGRRRRRTSSTRACTRRRWRRAASVADMDPVTGKLTLWCNTQAPHAHRTVYALVAGLPEHKIRVISPGHRRRLRQQGRRSTRATSARSSARSSPASR